MAGQRSMPCGIMMHSLQLLTIILLGTLTVECQRRVLSLSQMQDASETTNTTTVSLNGSDTIATTQAPPETSDTTSVLSNMSSTDEADSTTGPTGNPQPQGGLTPIFIGAIGAGIGVGFVVILIGIWCCCRRCASGSKDSSKDVDEDGKPRRLPSIPGGGRGVHRINGKTVRYLSDPALSLNHLPSEDIEDDGEYDYIDIALKKAGVEDEDGVKRKDGLEGEDMVKYKGLTDSMKKKKGLEILETEYEDLRPHGGLPEDNYIIAIEPPKSANGVVSPVVMATNEKPPMGMSMPKRVPKTVEASLRLRDSSRDSKPDTVTEVTPSAKSEEAVSTTASRAEENRDASSKADMAETMDPEYADLSAAEDSDDEAVSPQTPDDDKVIPDEAEEDDKSEVGEKPDTDTPRESVIEMEKAT